MTLEKRKTSRNNLKWTSKELEIIRQLYQGNHESNVNVKNTIKNVLGLDRSCDSIRKKASHLGLTKPRNQPWSPEQENKLAEMLGTCTMYQMAIRLGRTRNSIYSKLNDMGLHNKYRNGWYTMSDVIEILGVCDSTIAKWIATGKLKSTKYSRGTIYKITAQDLKSFIIRFPTELTGRNVDICQLVAILCPKSYKKD